MKCSNCDGSLEMEYSDNKTFAICPYCDQRFLIEDEPEVDYPKVTYTQLIINKPKQTEEQIKRDQINVSKEISHFLITEAVGSCAAVVFSAIIIIVALFVGIPKFIGLFTNTPKQQTTERIEPGSVHDFEGENYKVVVSQLEDLGFENIELIDLDNASKYIDNSDLVDSVSIGGDSNFNALDYFAPDDPVIVAYH